MTFNVWTFLFEVVNFLVLVYVLHRLLYRPLREAIDRRREANAKAQAEAEKARQEADRAPAATERSSWRTWSSSARSRSARPASRPRPSGKRRGRGRAGACSGAARKSTQQLERERAEALQALRAELVQSAVELAERFLREASDSTLQQQLAGRLVEELQQHPGRRAPATARGAGRPTTRRRRDGRGA